MQELVAAYTRYLCEWEKNRKRKFGEVKLHYNTRSYTGRFRKGIVLKGDVGIEGEIDAGGGCHGTSI